MLNVSQKFTKAPLDKVISDSLKSVLKSGSSDCLSTKIALRKRALVETHTKLTMNFHITNPVLKSYQEIIFRNTFMFVYKVTHSYILCFFVLHDMTCDHLEKHQVLMC